MNAKRRKDKRHCRAAFDLGDFVVEHFEVVFVYGLDKKVFRRIGGVDLALSMFYCEGMFLHYMTSCGEYFLIQPQDTTVLLATSAASITQSCTVFPNSAVANQESRIYIVSQHSNLPNGFVSQVHLF